MQIHCLTDITVESPDELIEKLSDVASRITGHPKDEILTSLRERERLSSTAIGKGVMLPHIRVDEIEADYIFFLKLDNPLKYVSPDGVDISFVFFIMSPLEKKTEYLRLVSSIVKMIKNESIYSQIRDVHNSEELKKVIQDNLLVKGITN
ncbi:MAG: PTS sugar transporter subunit IIA [Deltaproteobacteria bacterium]|nr:PTS sugar transporter subunit IIA [Deltaproteobacteria bacterium]